MAPETFVGDWSNHDYGRGPMDFAAMRRDGIMGGCHKLTDGLRFYLDPYAQGALPAMRSVFADGVAGAYHVLWGNRSITDQVDWWFSLLDQYVPGWRTDPRCYVMTDNEPFGYNQAPSIGQVNEAGDYILAKTGKVMPAYCPPWHYKDALQGLRYPLVSSSYGSNPVAHYRQAYPGPTSQRWMSAGGKAWGLQYGSRTVMGSQGTCDANAVLDTIDGIIATLGGDMATAEEIAKAVWGYPVGANDIAGDRRQPAGNLLKDSADMLNNGASSYDGRVGAVPQALIDIRTAAGKPVTITLAPDQFAALKADLAALLPKPPTAAEVAEELAKRLGNG